MGKFDVVAAIRGGNKRYSAGNGLSLHVRGASALWTYQFRDRETGKTRSVSLGSAKGLAPMSLSEARDARVRYAASVLDGTAKRRAEPVGKTFADALDGGPRHSRKRLDERRERARGQGASKVAEARHRQDAARPHRYGGSAPCTRPLGRYGDLD